MPRKSKEGVVKKSIPKKEKTKSLFVELSPEKYFVMCNGITIRDYRELAETLETLGDDVFYYHVSNERNDFANWINDVFEEKDLAQRTRNIRNRSEMMAVLYKHLFHKILAAK
jgi:hypothetical protein